jgi:hypothetical protein
MSKLNSKLDDCLHIIVTMMTEPEVQKDITRIKNPIGF